MVLLEMFSQGEQCILLSDPDSPRCVDAEHWVCWPECLLCFLKLGSLGANPTSIPLWYSLQGWMGSVARCPQLLACWAALILP